MSTEELTPEMNAEIDRLGLSRDFFQKIISSQGLELGQLSIRLLAESAILFEEWYPRLLEFSESKRQAKPFPSFNQLSHLEAALYRILKSKILDSENLNDARQFHATIFLAPLYVLPYVIETRQPTVKHPVFLTHEEWDEWYEFYATRIPDTARIFPWFRVQDWNGHQDMQSTPEDIWRSDFPADLTPLLVSWGSHSNSLSGGGTEELWGISAAGQEQFIKPLGIWVS